MTFAPPPRAHFQRNKYRYFLAALALCLSAGWLAAASTNLAPDAVSRATTWNSFEGDLAALYDGRTPDETEARPFTWQTKGILVFAWDEVKTLERVRIYVGEIGNNYQVRAYVGGRLDPTGALREPEGERTALVPNDERRVNTWIEVVLPPDTRADNIEIWTLGATQFYEIEIIAADPAATAVQRLSWGRVKSAAYRPVH